MLNIEFFEKPNIKTDDPISPYRRKSTNKVSGKPRGKYNKNK